MTKHALRYFVMLACILALSGCALEGIDHLPPGSTPSAVVGQRMFQQKRCIGCHNSDASGELAPDAADLRGTSLSYLAVLKQVRAPKGRMPARLKEDVTDEEVSSIYAWLQTFPKQTPTPMLGANFPTPVPEALNTPAPPPAPTNTLTPAPTLVPGQPTPTPAPPTATPTNTARPPQVDVARLIAAQEKADDLKVTADYAKDAATSIGELRNYANQGLAAAQALQNEVNGIRNSATGNLLATLNELQPHLDTYLRAAQAAAQTNDFAAARTQAATMVIEGRIFVLPLAQQMLVDVGRVGTVRGRIVNQSGQGLANAAVTVAYGRYKRGVTTDANGFFTAANIPAIKPIEVKAYASGYIYHEQNTEVAPGGTATLQLVLPRQGGDAPAIRVSDFSVTQGANGTTLRMKATHPKNDLAEDQIFALNPTLGIGVVLLSKGGDTYERTLPVAARGRWYFFAVDHKCFASNIMPVDAP